MESESNEMANAFRRRYDRQKECAESSVGHIFGEDYVCRKCNFDAYLYERVDGAEEKTADE